MKDPKGKTFYFMSCPPWRCMLDCFAKLRESGLQRTIFRTLCLAKKYSFIWAGQCDYACFSYRFYCSIKILNMLPPSAKCSANPVPSVRRAKHINQNLPWKLFAQCLILLLPHAHTHKKKEKKWFQNTNYWHFMEGKWRNCYMKKVNSVRI